MATSSNRMPDHNFIGKILKSQRKLIFMVALDTDLHPLEKEVLVLFPFLSGKILGHRLGFSNKETQKYNGSNEAEFYFSFM